MFVGDDTIEDGIFYSGLKNTDFAARRQMEIFHNFFTANGRLEIADAVTLLQIHKFLTHELEVIEKALLTLLVLAGDVSLTQQHQVVNIIACLKE